jgi:hypothetical protein
MLHAQFILVLAYREITREAEAQTVVKGEALTMALCVMAKKGELPEYARG